MIARAILVDLCKVPVMVSLVFGRVWVMFKVLGKRLITWDEFIVISRRVLNLQSCYISQSCGNQNRVIVQVFFSFSFLSETPAPIDCITQP